jgi:two-component system response regulator HydG
MFARASHGTLFLDEIGNLNMDVQMLLLRALQEKHYRPIGSREES